MLKVNNLLKNNKKTEDLMGCSIENIFPLRALW